MPVPKKARKRSRLTHAQNGGYVNPPRLKRSLRDPYEDWWDKQERRNYGEPVHEDNDMLGVFSLEEYSQWTAGKAFRWFVGYFAATAAFAGVIYVYAYPQKPSVKRTFPDGLEAELGGQGAMLVSGQLNVTQPKLTFAGTRGRVEGLFYIIRNHQLKPRVN